MKKIIAFSLIALLAVGAVSLTFAANPSGPGYAGDIMGMSTGRYVSDPHRTFRLVRNSGGSLTLISQSTIAAGNLVIWDTTAYPIAADGVSVTVTTTTGDARVAGVAVTAIPTADNSTISVRGTIGNTTATSDVGWNNWGWLQTYGKSAVVVTQATTASGGGVRVAAVGEAVCAGPVAGQITSFYASTSSASVNGNAGFAEETFTSGSTGYIFLKCE